MTYWDTIYKNDKTTLEPSSFSVFCKQFIEEPGLLFDIGCGNGRDSEFFAKNGLDVTAVDYSLEVIERNKIRNKITITTSNPTYIKKNVDNLNEIETENIKYIYSRFFIHSITSKQFDNYLNWVDKNLNKDGKLFIECRSTKDPMCGVGEKISDTEYINGHYRRFVDINEFVNKINSMNYSFEYINECNNLSIYNDENPVLIRAVIIKHNYIPKPNLYLLQHKNKLVNFLKECNENNLPIFATCGTMLGAVRNNGITPWDTDIDIGILEEDLQQFANVFKNRDYYISLAIIDEKNNLIEDVRFTSYYLDKIDIFKTIDLDTHLIWFKKVTDIKKNINNFCIQLNIMKYRSDYLPPFWEINDNTQSKDFIVHTNKELRISYECGRYNIPTDLFYPLIKVQFYDTYIFINNGYEIILKLWYKEKCLENYPLSELDYNDMRFTTGEHKIKYMYALGSADVQKMI